MSDTTTTPKGHPKGLYLLFFTEMWERFSYYGMRALFVLFMAKALLFDKELSSQIYGSYTGLVYLTPLIGGYLADRYWGNRKSIIVGGVLMALGQFFMFLSGLFFKENPELAPTLMFIGLGFLIFGNGFFKPNISTLVGQLYPKNDERIDKAFTIFYMGINLGAFIAPLLCGYLGDTGNPDDFKWGFLCACLGMLLSVIIFIVAKNKYLVSPEGEAIGVKPNNEELPKEEKIEIQNQNLSTENTQNSKIQMFIWGGIWLILLGIFYAFLKDDNGNRDLIGAFIFSLTLAAPGYIISDGSLTKIEKQRIAVIYIVAFFVIFFWSAFEQAGASLTYFAEEQTERNVFGFTVPASYFQSINAVAIVIFAPLFAILWSALDKRKMEPASPYKQALGLFLLAIGYLVIAFGVKGIEPGVKVSMLWLIGLYTIHTFGELCLSPIGLSMVNKLAPVKFASLLMGVWFLSTATANKFAGTLSSFYPESYVSVSKIQDLEQQYQIGLLPENPKYEQINGEKSVPFSNISLIYAEKDTSKKETIKLAIEKLQVVKAKSFLGFEIASLYDFFMLFVFMAGASSIVLFFLSRKLIQMMHGVK